MTQLPIHSMQDLVVVGQMLAQTDMVGARNPAEGFTVACICHQQGITFAQFADTYHLSFGRLSKRADAMLADLHKLGGSHVIKNRDSELASIQISYGKIKNREFSLSHEEAQGEEFYRKNPKYKTPRGRTQMMWARVVSDGVRAVCPEAAAGYYTPEEIEDFAGPAAQTVVPPEPVPEPAPQPEPANNYHTCPMGGEGVMGKPWTEFPVEHLEAALGLDAPEMTDGHRAQIRAILEQRAGQ